MHAQNARCLSSLQSAHFRVGEFCYPPGLIQPRHAHAESGVTMVLSGSLEETVARRQEYARALSAVVKPLDTEHANRIGVAGARTLQIQVLPGLPNETCPLGDWRWEHGGPMTVSFLRVLMAFRAGLHDRLEGAIYDLLASTGGQQP